MSEYRGDLEAALARVAQLEAENAGLRRQLQQTPAAQARLSDLLRRRSAALLELGRVERSARTALVVTGILALVAGLVFVLAIASMGAEGHPLNAAIFSVALATPLLATVAAIGAARRQGRAMDLAAVDHEINEALSGSEEDRPASPAVRVADMEEAEAEEEGTSPPSDAAAGKRA